MQFKHSPINSERLPFIPVVSMLQNVSNLPFQGYFLLDFFAFNRSTNALSSLLFSLPGHSWWTGRRLMDLERRNALTCRKFIFTAAQRSSIKNLNPQNTSRALACYLSVKITCYLSTAPANWLLFLHYSPPRHLPRSYQLGHQKHVFPDWIN